MHIRAFTVCVAYLTGGEGILFESVVMLTRRRLCSCSLWTISTSRSCFLWASSTCQTNRRVLSNKFKHTTQSIGQQTSLQLENLLGGDLGATVLPGWHVCCDARRRTEHGVGPPAAFASPTSAPGHLGRCEGAATPPGAWGGARSPLFALERE